MIRVSVQKNNVETNAATFPDQPTADAWLAQEQANGSFGDPSTYTVTSTDVTAQLAQQAAVQAAQATLDSTDWIVVKISECQLLGQPTAPLLTLYATQLAARQAARLVINPNTQN